MMPMEKTFNPTEAEARIYAEWETGGAFKAGANARRKPDGSPAEPFSIMIPPPNVTGSLHMGHAFNNTLQDILVRWHRMRGFDVLWQPGTDHAGIATQMVVERDLALAQQPGRRAMGREAFIAKVWEQKVKSEATILGQLRRLGASCDWSRTAFTMDPNFHDAVIKVFVEMFNHKDKDGNPDPLIYRGKRLVNWDPHFETAISDLEVENIEVDGQMWHFKYRLAGGESYEYVEKDAEGRVILREKRDYIAIATTRPETMLGDGAVAVHPSDTRYAGLVGKMVHLPLCDRLIPIITDEYPDPLFGSGAVKITGAHDFNDYAVAMRHNIPMYPLLDTKGDMRTDKAPDNMVPEKYRGMHRFRRDGIDGAREAIVADITAQGLAVTTLVKSLDPETGSEHLERVPLVEAKKIMQPFGDRSKVVIEPMLTDQWFVDTAKIVQPAIDAVRDGRTRILPVSHEKVYFHWLENIEPWCISRQLWWGHQIPVWYGPSKTGNRLNLSLSHSDDTEQFCFGSEQEARGELEKYYGFPVEFVSDKKEAKKLADIQGMSGSHTTYVPIWRDPDVLDTWFSSGLWPIGTLGWPEQTPELAKYFPTSTLVTGFDIIFFWVARMMMMQLAVVGEVPFKTVYVHALVRDETGRKMSKSAGNVLDPLTLIDEFGCDAVRFTLTAMAAMGRDLRLSTARIAGYRNFGTKLWNACRFAEMNGVWQGHATGAPPDATATVNKWIIGETARTLAEVDAALAEYRFDHAANALYTFVWGQVCDWYVEFAKPLFDGSEAAETRATMAWVLDQCMILLHPMMPFITEELWSTTGTRAKPLIHTDWPTYGADLIDPAAESEMGWVTTLIDEIRSARAELRVPVGLKLPFLRLGEELEKAYWLAQNKTLIERLARVDIGIVNLPTPAGPGELGFFGQAFGYVGKDAPKGWINILVPGATFALKVGDVIDIAGEKSRLAKAFGKLAKEIAGLKGRLNNPNFAASAPEEVVDEAKANLEARMDEAAKLQAALKRLAELA